MNFSLPLRLLVLVSILGSGQSPALAEAVKTNDKKADQSGNWLQLPSDGVPWRHLETGIGFPQQLGGFVLTNVFRDKRDEAGIALTYVLSNSNLKADVVLFPCQVKEIVSSNVEKVLRTEHEHLVSDIIALAIKKGYAERDRSELQTSEIEIFKKGTLPLTTQTLDLVSANGDPTNHPPLNQWVGLALYADYFVQMNVSLPAKKDSKTEEDEKISKQVDEIITLLIECIKEPSVVPEMLNLCQQYMSHPLEDEGRNAADALMVFSKVSPIVKVALPGEVITPALNEIGERSKDTSLDLLRGFIVGSGVVALQGGSVVQSLEEGSRVMGMVRELLRKKGVNVDSTLLDEVAAASQNHKAAQFIQDRLKKSAPPTQ